MKSLDLNQMEIIETGFAAGTGNRVAFVLRFVGVTWGAVAAALLGASGGCFD